MVRIPNLNAGIAGLLLLGFSSLLGADGAITGQDIPQLLGVWYGQYLAPDGHHTEIWLEVSFQKPVDGYEVRGFNRWHVVDIEESVVLGAESVGIGAENFDTVSGRIAEDGGTVRFVEDHSNARFDAAIVGGDTLNVSVTREKETDPTYEFTLKLVDTDYSPSETTLMGVDISHHSGDIDWTAIREAGFSFAYVKATEGVDNPDARFEEHWQTLRSMDFPRGAYHFYVTEDDPAEQARFFASRLREDAGTLPPVVDVELLGHGTHGDMTEELLQFLEAFEEETGCRPMIYTGPVFWDRYYRPEFSRYPLWLTEVGVIMPKVPFGWKNWTLWQRKIEQTMDGVEKDADISILHPEMGLEDLTALVEEGCASEARRTPQSD